MGASTQEAYAKFCREPAISFVIQTRLFLKQIDEVILSFLRPKLPFRPADSLSLTWPADFAMS